MIEIPEHLLEEVVSHSLRKSPYEACGWLAGRSGGVERTYPVANVARDRRSAFVMDPEAQIRAMRDIREAGFELTGTYHSHPRTPPYPSSKDRQLARYPNSKHLIISLAGPHPEVRCYEISENGEKLAALIVTRAPEHPPPTRLTPAFSRRRRKRNSP